MSEPTLEPAVEAAINKLAAGAGAANTRTAKALEAVRHHPIATLAIAMVILYLFWIFGPAALIGFRDHFGNKEIERNKTAIAGEQTAGAADRAAANQLDTERQAEDLKRSNTLQPARIQTAANTAGAAARRQTAEANYEKDRNARPVDSATANLHARNCADLANLYPNDRVAACQ